MTDHARLAALLELVDVAEDVGDLALARLLIVRALELLDRLERDAPTTSGARGRNLHDPN